MDSRTWKLFDVAVCPPHVLPVVWRRGGVEGNDIRCDCFVTAADVHVVCLSCALTLDWSIRSIVCNLVRVIFKKPMSCHIQLVVCLI